MITTGLGLAVAILSFFGGKITDFHKEHQAFEQQRFQVAKELCEGEMHDCGPLKTYYPKLTPELIGPPEPVK